MTEFEIKTLRSAYLQNLPYYYPLPTYDADKGGMYQHPVNTGWQVIPNILWSHYCSPKQFYEMVIKYESIKVVGASCTMFNMIPIQTQLAIQGTSSFNAFNNTIYAWGYTDDLYETPPFNWLDLYLNDNQLYVAYKEGAYPSFTAGDASATNQYGQTVWWEQGATGMPRQSFPSGMPKDMPIYTMTRQRLPIYFYDFTFNKWYPSTHSELSYSDYLLNFGGARCSGFSGAFWDPLNRPDQIMELRPGKNAIKFSWEIHDCDGGHWFNTDAVALRWPYPRDGPINPKMFNEFTKDPSFNEWTPSLVDPRTSGIHAADFSKRRLADPPQTGNGNQVNAHMTLPYDYQCLPDWAAFPIVPVQWWAKEIQESNPYTQSYWEVEATGESGHEQQKRKIFQQMWNVAFPGTEYEQYKYPPTQWFTKMVPLFDSNNALITLEAQVFFELTLKIIGKERKSAIFAPTWGPWAPQNLYSADPKGKYNLAAIRGRSGGARRTWLCNDKPAEIANPQWWPTGHMNWPPTEAQLPSQMHESSIFNVTKAAKGEVPMWITPLNWSRNDTAGVSTVTVSNPSHTQDTNN